MVASSSLSAQARIQQILRTTAAHFALSPIQARPAPRGFLFASEFKDPIPLRCFFPARQASRVHQASATQ